MTELEKFKANKDKIELLNKFLDKQILCTKHSWDVDNFGDTETRYTELNKKAKQDMIYKFLGLDYEKLQKELLEQAGIEI